MTNEINIQASQTPAVEIPVQVLPGTEGGLPPAADEARQQAKFDQFMAGRDHTYPDPSNFNGWPIQKRELVDQDKLDTEGGRKLSRAGAIIDLAGTALMTNTKSNRKDGSFTKELRSKRIAARL